MCLRCRVRCSISLSSFPSVSVCGIRRIFFVFMVFFGTSSNVVVPRDCIDLACRPQCDQPCATAAAASIADTVPAVQTRWWWFFRELLLDGAALMSPCILKPAGGGHQMAAACWCEYRGPAWISLAAAAYIADTVPAVQTRWWWFASLNQAPVPGCLHFSCVLIVHVCLCVCASVCACENV